MSFQTGREAKDKPARPKPRCRGWLHQWALPVAVPAAVGLVSRAPSGTPKIAAAVYAVSLIALLATSAVYHRGQWAPGVREWLGRLDVTMIFALIAGSYTPVALLVLGPLLGRLTLVVVWGAVAMAGVVQLLGRDWPKWATAVGCVAVGWFGVIALPQVAGRVGTAALVLLAAGGILYTAGAVVYALERPDPCPRVFGYHEIFHALVLVAAVAHYAAISRVVLSA